MLGLSLVAVLGGVTVGGIGFAMSYDTLARVALGWGFSEDLAPLFPVGVDASIVAFLALDLYMIRKGTPWPMLRLAAHAMTGATIWFNASSQGSIRADPVRAASHGVMPVLFVLGVEAARRLIVHKAKLEAGTVTDTVPLKRWLLSPVKTPIMFRRMHLAGVTSYPEMVRREQDLLAYELWLKRKYDGDLSKATDDELLPLRMAARGFTVDQALAMPDDQEREAERRAEEAEQRQREARTRRDVAEKEAEAQRVLANGRLDQVRARVDGETASVRAHAQAQITAAEKAAQLEQAALESADVAEARAREAEAEARTAAQNKVKAQADLEAAGLEKEAAEVRRGIEEADRIAKANVDKAAADIAKTAAEARDAAAELDREAAVKKQAQARALAETELAEATAAEARLAAAEAREAAAEVERRALEAEEANKLKPRERAVRRVARMILTRAEGEKLPLQAIQDEFGLQSPSTASEYRTEAVDLIRNGYTADGGLQQQG
ncbi:DUF2637 domain-containing protein [Kitasatospora sp. NPDC059088]|uniref:DUF2637 domain-containing protein n=1 Tax=Kitasatospora sp. NPDC059088 TaxID=3346722 RepID=UPI0036C82F10